MRSVRGDSISGRTETGDTIASRAEELDTKPVKGKLTAFVTVHKRYTKADTAHAAAGESLAKVQAVAAEIDAELDPAVLELANLLPSIGLPRGNPFKPWGVPAPSNVVKLPWPKEAKAAATLAKKAAAAKGATAQIKALAKKIAGLAAKLDAATKKGGPIEKAESVESAAVAARNVIGVEWERALAKLKNATETAEDDGATGLYEKLLGNPPPRPVRGPRKAKAAAPAASTP